MLPHINQTDLYKLLQDDPDDLVRIKLLFRIRKLENMPRFETHSKLLVNAILSGDTGVHFLRSKTLLEVFAGTMEVTRYAWVFQYAEQEPLEDFWNRRGIKSIDLKRLLEEQNILPHDSDKMLEIIKLAQVETKRTAKEWASDLASWDKIVEMSRSFWGEQWLHFHFANIASGIKSSKETYREFPDLLDQSKSLCKRTRYARLRAGMPDWWKKQLEAANTEQEKMFVLLILFTWGSANTITHLIEPIDNFFKQLSIDNWHRITSSLKQATYNLFNDTDKCSLSIDVTDLPSNLSEKTITTLGIRTKVEDTIPLYRKYLINYQGYDKVILQFCQKTAFEITKVDSSQWPQSLIIIADSYSKGIILEPRFLYRKNYGNYSGPHFVS